MQAQRQVEDERDERRARVCTQRAHAHAGADGRDGAGDSGRAAAPGVGSRSYPRERQRPAAVEEVTDPPTVLGPVSQQQRHSMPPQWSAARGQENAQEMVCPLL